ncbi:helix-turn-helix domain-containing protein [Brevibacterium iodinum]|uniref:helix-turn-helix domain-containing protein n=1 Tax=Brevibacterium iodinum TaxID=31943 RepID=UPI000C7888CD
MEGELQRVVGENLRRHRLRLGLSQEAFAERLGVHRTYMGGVERGERNLTLKTVEKLAETIDVSPIELLSRPVSEDRGSRTSSSSS